MDITRIRTDSITPKDSGICGEFSVTFDNILCIHKIYVINGKKGLFIAFPNTGEMKLFKNCKRYSDIAHPTTQEFRKEIEDRVLEQYHIELDKLA
jgi:stage V sporulation protein G